MAKKQKRVGKLWEVNYTGLDVGKPEPPGLTSGQKWVIRISLGITAFLMLIVLAYAMDLTVKNFNPTATPTQTPYPYHLRIFSLTARYQATNGDLYKYTNITPKQDCPPTLSNPNMTLVADSCKLKQLEGIPYRAEYTMDAGVGKYTRYGVLQSEHDSCPDERQRLSDISLDCIINPSE